MNFNAIFRNVRKHGIRGTLQIRRQRIEAQKEKDRRDRLCTWYHDCAFERSFLRLGDDARAEYMERIYAVEKELKELRPKTLKRMKKENKARYLKEVIPACYAEHAAKPVEDKIIIMESGAYSPSPSSYYVGKALEEQGEYEVKYMALMVRRVSEIEFYENAVDFVKELATAKAVFLSTANDILSQFDVRPETKVIQLWHGVGIFKKVGYSTVDNPKFGKSRKDREEYNQYRNYTYVTIPSEEQSWIFEESMQIPKEAGIIVPVGVSRTDVFYDPAFKQAALEDLYAAFPQIEGKKIILYAPTFRGETATAQAPDRLDVEKMAEALSDEYVLLIRYHGLCKTLPPIPEQWENTFAFDMNTNNILQIEQSLAIADICITDYSSVAFEYAILERPILFFAYDLEEYIDHRGMYYDYEEITPGPVCRTTEEMVDYIVHLDTRFDREKIHAFREKYVTMCDGHATERTLALLEA